MTKKSTRLTHRSNRDGKPNEKANGSGPTLEPGHGNVITLLRRWNLKALSVLAMLADYGGAISGSGSLEIFCSNSTGTDSDLDIYLPAVREAAQDAIHVLKTSGVRWKNFLSDIIKDVRQYGITIVPYWQIYETVNRLRSQEYASDDFQYYLRESLSEGDATSSKLVEKFVVHFLGACHFVHKRSAEINDPDNTVWVYVDETSAVIEDPDDTVSAYSDKTPRFTSIPSAISKKINHILETLDSRYSTKSKVWSSQEFTPPKRIPPLSSTHQYLAHNTI